MGTDKIVMTTHARSIIEPIVHEISEFLPMNLQGETIWGVNMLNRVDCLDESHCEIDRYENGNIMDISKYGFVEEKFNLFSLFDIINFPVTQIFATEGRLPPELEFKHVVESNNHKGLKFVEVWDSEKK
jgi:hypothetical protein